MTKTSQVLLLRDHKTVYREGEMVIKRFDHSYLKSQVINEALNMARVEETELNTPALLAVRQDSDYWEIVMAYVEGETLSSLMKEDMKYLELFVDLQIKVHETHSPILSKMKDKLNHKIKSSSLPATIRLGLRRSLDKQNIDLCLCHGDFFPSNVIISKESEPYIIDWAHASMGSKNADVCNSYLELWIEFSKSIADSYLAIYCEKTKTDQADILSWLQVTAAARLSKKVSSEESFLLSLMKDIL